ncbi:MAG: energy transducer TonB [Candidatus Firestonebacteria bacterium]
MTDKFGILKISFLVSLLLHFAILFFSSFTPTEGEINPEEYKIVQLMNLEQPNPYKPVTPAVLPKVIDAPEVTNTEGEIKITEKEEELSQETPLQQVEPQKEEFSLYVPFFKVAQLPEFITKIKPEYPAKAKLKGIESTVLVEIYIDIEGNTRKIIILKSGGEDFDNATTEALYKSKFRPAISKDGKAVPVRIRIPFKFELE